MQKLITIVIPARNDNYYDNFSKIINFTINYSLSKIYQLNLENIFEILLIDWSSNKKLNRDIYIPKKFKKNIKVAYVNGNSNNRFNVSEAQNFGLEIAKTKYCFLAHADQMYSKTFFLNLSSYVNNKYLLKRKTEESILYIPRKFIDENFFSHYLSEKTIDEYFDNLGFINQKWKNDQFFVGGGQSGWFGTKKVLQKFGGLKEDLILKNKKEIISADLEFYQRYSQHFKFYDSSNFGIFAYRYPYVFSKNRNTKLLKRMPPIKIDRPLKKILKKRKFIFEKINYKNFNNDLKLPEYNFDQKKIFGLKKYIYFSKNEIIDNFNEDKKINFIIRNFLVDAMYSQKIIAYMEYGYLGSSIISVIGNIFKGIDILAADFTYKISKQKVHQRLYRLANYFHISKKVNRYGKTKLLSFDRTNQSNFIFSYLPQEKYKTIMTINPININLKLFRNFINKNNKFLYCLILKSENKKFDFLNRFFIKKIIYKNTYIYLHKSALDKHKQNTYNIIKTHSKYLNLKYYFYRIIKIFFSA